MSEFRRLRDLTAISAATLAATAAVAVWASQEHAQAKVDCHTNTPTEAAAKDCIKDLGEGPADTVTLLAIGALVATAGLGKRAYDTHEAETWRETVARADARAEQSTPQS